MRWERVSIACVAIAVAAISIGQLSISTAGAAEYHSEASHTLLVGEQVGEGVMTFKAGTVKCNSITYTGTASSTTYSTEELTPTFKECTAFGFVSTSVHPDECNTPIQFSYQNGPTSGSVSIPCSIVVTAFSCYVKIITQLITAVMSRTNNGSGANRRVRHKKAIKSKLKYRQESKSFPGCTNGEFTDGSWEEEFETRGTNTSGEAVGIWVE
jgi:hypothetical protein